MIARVTDIKQLQTRKARPLRRVELLTKQALAEAPTALFSAYFPDTSELLKPQLINTVGV